MTLLIFERVSDVSVSCFDMESSLLEVFKHISRAVELQILQKKKNRYSPKLNLLVLVTHFRNLKAYFDSFLTALRG